MAKFRKVHTSFWDDTYMEKASPEDKYFYLFLLTNPLCTECGIYSISIKKMCFYTGYNSEAVSAILKRLEIAGKICYNIDTSEIAILKKLRYIEKLGKPTLDCLKSELERVKDLFLIEKMIQFIVNKQVESLFNDTLKSLSTIRGLPDRQERERERERERDYKADNDTSIEKKEDMVVQEMMKIWMKYKPRYAKDTELDFHCLLALAYKIAEYKGWKKAEVIDKREKDVLDSWEKIVKYVISDSWYSTKSLKIVNSQWQSLVEQMDAAKNGTTVKKTETPVKIIIPKTN